MCYTVNVARKKASRKATDHPLLTERLFTMCSESILNFQGETQTFKAYIDPIDSFTADSLAGTLNEKARTISIACGEGDTEATLYFFDEDQRAIEVEDEDGNISTVTATVDLSHLEYDDKLILQLMGARDLLGEQVSIFQGINFIDVSIEEAVTNQLGI